MDQKSKNLTDKAQVLERDPVALSDKLVEELISWTSSYESRTQKKPPAEQRPTTGPIECLLPESGTTL